MSAAKKIALQITPTGGARMLHSDEVDLSAFGEISVVRASHVEWCPILKWHIRSAKTYRLLHWGFDVRADALEWERDHYSPTGAGWAELTIKETA